MSRGLTSGMQTAVAAGNVTPALFGSFDFASGTIYIWTGMGSITWNGHTWTGLGDFLRVDKIPEDSIIAARSVSFSLSGVPSSMVTVALADDYRTRAAKLWLACFDSSNAIIADPIQLFSGIMNQMTIRDSGQACTIDLTVESRLIDLQRQRERRFTDADQRFFFPTDTGLQYVVGLQDQTINWGVANPTPTSPSSAPSGSPTPGQGYGGPYSRYV